MLCGYLSLSRSFPCFSFIGSISSSCFVKCVTAFVPLLRFSFPHCVYVRRTLYVYDFRWLSWFRVNWFLLSCISFIICRSLSFSTYLSLSLSLTHSFTRGLSSTDWYTLTWVVVCMLVWKRKQVCVRIPFRCKAQS